MASPRTIALGLAVGTIFAGYLALWLHFVAFVALALGASALVLILVLAAAFGEDAEATERAWRAAAGPVAGRTPGEPSSDEPRTWQQPRPRDEAAGSATADRGATGVPRWDANDAAQTAHEVGT